MMRIIILQVRRGMICFFFRAQTLVVQQLLATVVVYNRPRTDIVPKRVSPFREPSAAFWVPNWLEPQRMLVIVSPKVFACPCKNGSVKVQPHLVIIRGTLDWTAVGKFRPWRRARRPRRRSVTLFHQTQHETLCRTGTTFWQNAAPLKRSS